MTTLRTFLLAGLAICALAVAVPAQAQDVVKIRVAHTVPTDDTLHAGLEEYAKRVKAATNSRVEIEIFPNGQLGNDPKIIEGARLGTIDAAATGNPFFTSFNPELNILDLPYLFRDSNHAYAVLDSAIGEELARSMEKHGLKSLSFFISGFRALSNGKRPVKTPQEVAGLKIRVPGNPAHLQAWRLLGANPAPMPFPEVYLALKTGTIDAQETNIVTAYASKFQEVQKYLSLTAHAYTVFHVVMNASKFQALPADAQRALLAVSKDTFKWQRELNEKVEVQYLQKMRDAGMVVEESPDREAFRRVVAAPVAEEFVRKFGADMLERIRQTK